MTAQNKQSGRILDKGFKYFVNKEVRMGSGFGIVQEAPVFFDHFILPQTMATNWVSTVVGTTPTFSILNAGIGGVAEQLTSSSSGDAINSVLIMGASTGSAFTCAKAAKDRPLVFEVRAIIPTTTNMEWFMGWIGVAGRATAKNLEVSATSTLTTSTAADIAALGYSTVASSGAMASGVVGAIASLNNVDATTKATPLTMDTNYHVYRVELDVNGNATYLIDGKFAAYQPTAVTPSAALYPSLELVTRTGGTTKVDYDYAYVSCSAATTAT